MRVAQEREKMDEVNRLILQEIKGKLQDIQNEELRVKEQILLSNERFKIREELAEAEARIEVCTRFEDEEETFRTIDEIPCDNTHDRVEHFLQSQPTQDSPLSNEPKHSDSPTSNRTCHQVTDPTTLVNNQMVESSPHTQLNPNVPPYLPPTANDLHHHTQPNVTSTDAVQNNTSNMENPSTCILQNHLTALTKLVEGQAQSRLPIPKPEVFNGDPLKFPVWLKAFETLIETRAVNSTERLHFLGRYVAGEAKEVIEGYMLMDGDDAYERAKDMLSKRYGDPFTVASAFRKKLESWPQVPPQDPLALRRYADFLLQCEKAMEKVDSLKFLNDDQQIHRMASKLPKWALTRWGRKVYTWKNEKKKSPPFAEFVQYVVVEADIACDPITLSQQKTENSPRSRRPGDYGNSKNTFRKPSDGLARSLATKVSGENANKEKPEVIACAMCGKTHELESCKSYLDMDVKARKEFAKTKGLCFGCLRQGHVSRDCKDRKRCDSCKKGHPTSLHGDLKRELENTKPPSNQNETEKRTSHCTKSVSNKEELDGTISSMIVPVWVYHINKPENAVLVYALLDDQSDTTFVSLHTLTSLGVEGHATQISLSTMNAANEIIETSKINGLVVNDFNRDTQIRLPQVFSCNDIPTRRSQIPRPEMAASWTHLKGIATELVAYRSDIEIGLLIGANCPRAIVPRRVIPGRGNEPYALQTDLGWGIVGNVTSNEIDTDIVEGVAHRIVSQPITVVQNRERPCTFQVLKSVKEVINPQEIRRIMESDFSERSADRNPISLDDMKFLDQLKSGIHKLPNGHYEMPLPFRSGFPELPNNKVFALRRLERLKTRMQRDQRYYQHYKSFMNDLLQRGYAEPVPEDETNEGKVWYIPHHGVYHPQKPNKLRVVFDCSASYGGKSLNQYLLQGPDQMNGLIGVLSRFRQYPIAFSCDVEAMFHQFHVNAEHRNYLRFLWWEDGEVSKEPKEYRMTVHLFGATSSPGCANYGLKAFAENNEKEFGKEVANFVKRDFYVDDGLKSLRSVPEAVSVIQKTTDMLSRGGLRLHKFASNSKDVLASVSPDDRASNLKDLDCNDDTPPIERTLGVQWCIESDSFMLRIIFQLKPCTRRGILSTISSIYDPLGFASPFLLTGRQILQDLCRDKAEWDDPVPEEVRQRWEKFRSDLLILDKMKVPRCLAPTGFDDVTSVEIHHFSDASTVGYGQCSYVRLINADQKVHCAFIMGKSRVAPLKHITIPRLELSAALVAVKVSTMLNVELNYENIVDVFWTDSKVVLGYVCNDSRRFQVFVANRVQQIRNVTSPKQWNYVESEANPADDASRGLTAEQLVSNARWLNGPSFLWDPDFQLPAQREWTPSEGDPEVKKVKSFATITVETKTSMLDRLNYFSCWYRTRRAIANCMNLKNRLISRIPSRNSLGIQTKNSMAIDTEDLQGAESEILQMVQEREFSEELKILRSLQKNDPKREDVVKIKTSLKKTSCLYRLEPFLDSQGILRVGGRLKRSDLIM